MIALHILSYVYKGLTMTRKTSISLALAGMLLGSSLFAVTSGNVATGQNYYSAPGTNSNSNSPAGLPGVEVGGDDIVIPNAPMITPTSIIELSAIGMGIAPETSYSPAQALAMAKRAAIVDAYRQIGEKMYGVRVNAQDTVRDMVLKNSTVKTKVMAVIRNAEIVETVYKDGLCQVSMELKLDGKRWYRVLTGEEF